MWQTIWNVVSLGPDHPFNYAAVSVVLLALGVFAMVTRRNAVALLLGVELILNAAAINFVAFGRFPLAPGSARLDGQIFVLFLIPLAAAEAAVALAMVLSVYRTRRSIDLDRADELNS